MAWFRGGRAHAVERIDDATAADERVLDHLARLGCDAATPCVSTHFVYVLGHAGAEAIATKLRGDGWQTTVEPEDEVDIDMRLVTATRRTTLDSSSVRRTRTRLEALAAEHDGVYDGWQATAL